MAEPKKMGRPRKYATTEEAEAARKQKARAYVEANRDAIYAKNRERSRERLAERAIQEGREPGKRGNPKRQTPEERNAYVKAWREANRDKVRKREADRARERRREKAAAEGREVRIGRAPIYTEQERVDLRRKRSLDYWKRNPEKRKQLSQSYYDTNRDLVIANTKARFKRIKQENPELYRKWKSVTDRNRRARLNGNGGSHTKADIEALWDLQKGRCVVCLERLGTKFHVDHHDPLAKGGSNGRSNLRLLHPKCNLEKGARDPFEHAQRNGRLCY